MTAKGRESDAQNSEFAQLNLRRWPFDIVPSAEGVEYWIGRPDVGKRLRRLVDGAARVPTSRIVLVWAAFGSGKSHALRYAEYLADERRDLIAAYVVVPQGIRSFLDIFKAVIDSLLAKQVLEAVGQDLLRTQGLKVNSDAERAIVRISVGSPEEKRLATSWLRGDRLLSRDLRVLGLTRRVDTVSDAVQVLNDLVGAVYRHHAPIILLFDEVQELEELGRKLSETIGGLHKLFDLNPRGLTLVFSFTTGSRTTLRSILGEALFDRTADVIALPPLDVQEAVDFINAVITTWSIDETRTPTPFTTEAIRAVVERLDRNGTILTPRVLMKAFDRILREGKYDIASGEITIISDEYALQVLDADRGDELQ